jgi:prephenate dehydrogenase/chorismate mutase
MTVATTDPARSTQLLEQHRRDIEALDRRILHLVCERLELARQIGVLKTSLGVPLRNFQVESAVFERISDTGRLLGLDPGLGRDLARFLVAKAVEEQATARDAEYSGDALRVLVIGGKGGMGRWFVRFLLGQGHRVEVWDPMPDPAPCPQAASVESAAADADLVVVAVPMEACAAVLEEVAAIGPPGVVAEMCSLKGHLLSVFDGLRGRGVRLVPFHPMFGPDVRTLEGRTVVVCSDADARDRAVVRGLFAETSARLVELTVAEHDRRMAVVLGLTHLANLVVARAVAASGLDAAELDQVAGTTFQRQMATTREVVGENPELYHQIQHLSPDTGRAAGWLHDAVEAWLGASRRSDSSQFVELMQECRDALG